LVSQAKNTVLAGPASGSNAAPTFRSLVAADLPIDTPPTGAGFWSWYFENAPLSLVASNTMANILKEGGAGGYAGYVMYIPRPITISNLTVSIGTAVAGGTFDVGLYKFAGGANSLVASTGGMSTATGGANTSLSVALTQGTVTLAQGWYYFVVTSSTVTTVALITWTSFSVTLNTPCTIMMKRTGALNLVYALGSSGGVLPTTMPTWTAQPTSGDPVAPPVVYFCN
jgi:hypothetical protein